MRAGFVARGAAYAMLGWQAFRLYRGLRAPSGIGERALALEAFRWPFGDWLVVLGGGRPHRVRGAAGVCSDHESIGAQSRRRSHAARSRRLGGQPQPVRRGGTGRRLCAARMGHRRRRLVPECVDSRRHRGVYADTRCATWRTGPLASGRRRSRIRCLRLLRDHARALSAHPTRRLKARAFATPRRSFLMPCACECRSGRTRPSRSYRRRSTCGQAGGPDSVPD
jgi:hypothetical protein